MEIQINKKYNQLFLENQLDRYNFANFFSVIQMGQKSYFNISKTLIFNNIQFVNPSDFYQYQLKQTDTWTGISFRYYKTYKLWWLICKFNKIQNPLAPMIPGMIIKIPSNQIVDSILYQINIY